MESNETESEEIPNEETLKAMEDCRNNINMERMPNFTCIEDFLKYIESL